MGIGASLITAGLTTAFGFFAFVLGQLALKLFVDPIQEQKSLVGRVTHALTYYRRVGPGTEGEARIVYKDLAAGLRTNLQVFPFYRFFSRLRLILPAEQVRLASSALIGLSNTVHKNPAADDVNRFRREVERSLRTDR